MLKSITSLLILLFTCSTILVAQQDIDSTEAEIIKPIQQLFEGMLHKDTALMQSVFHPDTRLATTYTDKDGKSHFEQSAIGDFITSIGSIPAEMKLEEKILAYEVKTDDNLAIVWTPYEFYLNDQFSHCGVNAFELFRSEKGWIITSIIDTRRKEKCNK